MKSRKTLVAEATATCNQANEQTFDRASEQIRAQLERQLAAMTPEEREKRYLVMGVLGRRKLHMTSLEAQVAMVRVLRARFGAEPKLDTAGAINRCWYEENRFRVVLVYSPPDQVFWCEIWGCGVYQYCSPVYRLGKTPLVALVSAIRRARDAGFVLPPATCPIAEEATG